MKKVFWVLFVLITFISCEDDNTATPKTNDITFTFEHRYQNQSLTIVEDNTLSFTNVEGNQYNIKSLKYYISKIVLLNASGERYDVNMYKLINPAESNADFQTFVLKDVPEGNYTSLEFIFGVDTIRNISPFGLENNSSNNAMEWPYPLGGGYHFMMMEGVYKNNNNLIAGYAIHLGKNHNQYYAQFPISVTMNGENKPNISIVMNVEQWFDGQNKINLNNGFGYIMEDDAKQLLFKQNASSVFSAEQK